MFESVKSDLQAVDFRSFSAVEWADFKRRLERQARVQRSQEIRVALGAVSGWLFRLPSALAEKAGALWRVYQVRRRRNRAVQELQSLSDQHLRDIGLRRCEIRSVLFRPGLTRPR